MAKHSHSSGQNPEHDKLSAKRRGHAWNTGQNEFDKLSAFGRKPSKECDHDEQPAVLLDERKRVPVGSKAMRFTSLHHHSTYSFLDGFGLPEAHVRRATELNMSTLAMTEHGNNYSHAKFEQAAREAGVKPIFGVELYGGPTDEKNRKQSKNHLTVLAKDQQGYRNLLQLISRSWKEGYYYEPTVSHDMLAQNRDGLVVLSGCQGSLLFSSLVGGKGIDPGDASYRRALSVARRFKRTFDGNYFIEVQAFPELPLTRQANPLLARIAADLRIPLVATLDCHYTQPMEKEVQQVLHAVRGMTTVEEKAREWGYTADLCPPLSDRELRYRLQGTGLTRDEATEAILNTESIAQDCNVELPKLPMVRFPLPRGYSSAKQLWDDLIKKGWEERGCNRMSYSEKQRYKERLRHEKNIIEGKDYLDYFLVVANLVQFAKNADIGVGPARGSAAASLICWLLRITEVNPMLFSHLVFERFIDVTREDLPDIDLDFESDRRGEITDYLVIMYGRECVTNIGTFTKYKSKNALDDVARVHRIAPYEVERIKEVLLERSSGDLRASATIEDTVEQFDQARQVIEDHPQLMQATHLEGNVRGFGIHAAGVAVANQPITDVCSIIQKVVKKRVVQVVAVDKYDAEYLGILKIDMLALSALDALVTMCRIRGHKPSFLYEIPIVDEATIQGFKNGDCVGIFQYEGRAMSMVNGAIKPDDFDEVCHITALARPGPLHNGAVAAYVEIKRGSRQPDLIHPALDEICGFTQWQVVYQEQILRIVREIGDFDWTHAAYIRKIISRKLGDAEFNRQWERFWAGCQRLHPDMSEETAKGIWGLCTTAGSYAFNAAHSISYGYIAWWTQWWKQHDPDAFYAAMLHRADKKSGGDSSNAKASVQSKARLDPQVIMLNDALKHDKVILPPHLGNSGITWQLGDKPGELLAGFDQIPDIGDATARSIVEWRDGLDVVPKNWQSLMAVKGIGPKKMEKIKGFAEAEDPFKIHKLRDMIDAVREDSKRLGLPTPTHKAIEVPYETGEDQEVVWIGVGVHRNLRDIFEVNRARTGEELDPETVKSPELNEWMLIAGYDGTDLLSLRVSRWKYPRFKKILWKIKLNQDVLVVQGVKPGWRNAREIYVNAMWVVDPEG